MDKSYIKNIIQQALNKEFTNSSNRRHINEYHDRLQMCCVFCGDSKDEHKKRGNLYFNKLLYVCFNCGVAKPFDRYAKDMGIFIDADKRIEIIEHLNNNISYKDAENDFLDTEFDKFLNFEDVERIFNDFKHNISDFKPVAKNNEVYNYLVNRGINDTLHKNIYEGKYWINNEKFEPIIILLNRRGDKILGVQIRNLKEGKKRLFKIYNYETLYKWIYNTDIIDLDLMQLVAYNKLSNYFNILNIDFSKPITIFEGYLDSLFFPNSIGVIGVNTDMYFLESIDLDLRYFYDNDSAGYESSYKKLKAGFSVFLWKKLFESIVDNKKNDDPYKLMYRISKVKDLNKLAELVKNPYHKLKLENYFSTDEFDMIWLPKKEKKPYINFKIK